MIVGKTLIKELSFDGFHNWVGALSKCASFIIKFIKCIQEGSFICHGLMQKFKIKIYLCQNFFFAPESVKSVIYQKTKKKRKKSQVNI